MRNILAAGIIALLSAAPALAQTGNPKVTPERIRGTVTAISADAVTVQTATGKASIVLGSDTKYLTETRSDLDHIATDSYIGVAAKNVGEKLVALDVLIFPPSLKGAAEGSFGWDKVPDTTLSGGARTSSTMTNGSVAAVAGSARPASVGSTMTNGSVAAQTAERGTKQLKVTYKGGEQTILVPPTAPIVQLQLGTLSDLKPGDTVFVNALADSGKTTAALILVGRDGVAPPI